MKKKNIRDFFNKKENIVITALALVFCMGLIVTRVNSTSIPLHDGDVLVDSKAVSNENASKEETSSTDTKTSNLEKQRAAFDIKRNEIISKLDKTIDNSSNKSEKTAALEEKEKLVLNMKQEVEIEGIITSKSLPNSLVIITDDNVNITCDSKKLDQKTVAKICNIVMEETGKTADKIVVQSSYKS